MQYVTGQIVLTERKISLFIVSLNVKNNGKESLKLSKVKKENWLARIFRKYLIERKLERTRTRTQSSQYEI